MRIRFLIRNFRGQKAVGCYSKSEEDIKTFTGKQKRRGFVTTRLYTKNAKSSPTC